MSLNHPDFEALSAYFDGEAPELAAHVSGCADCRLTLRWLRTASAMVQAPVPPRAESDKADALARALEAFGSGESTREGVDDRHPAATPVARRWTPAPPPLTPAPAPVPPAVTPISAGRRRERRGGGSGMWVGLGSAAAVLVAFVIGIGVLGGGGGDGGNDTLAAGRPESLDQAPAATAGTDNRTAAGPGPSADETSGAVGDAAGSGGDGAFDGGIDGGVDGGDLGDIPDAAALAARAGPQLRQREATVAAAPGVSGLDEPSPVAPPAEPTPKAVGTRPCEIEARTARPELGTIVYFATGQVSGTPVVVLGFEPLDGPVILLALAQQEGCRVVLEAAGP